MPYNPSKLIHELEQLACAFRDDAAKLREFNRRLATKRSPDISQEAAQTIAIEFYRLGGFQDRVDAASKLVDRLQAADLAQDLSMDMVAATRPLLEIMDQMLETTVIINDIEETNDD